MNLLSLTMKIVESKLLARVSDIVDSAGKGNSLACKLLPWSDLALRAIPLDICGDREGRVELVGVWLRILGLSKLLDVPGPEFIVLLWCHRYRVSANFEHRDRVTLPVGSVPPRLRRGRQGRWHSAVAVRWQRSQPSSPPFRVAFGVASTRCQLE